MILIKGLLVMRVQVSCIRTRISMKMTALILGEATFKSAGYTLRGPT